MVKGLDELEANITKLMLQNQLEAKKAVMEVAEDFAKTLERNTSFDANSKTGIHLRDDIQISGFKGGGQGIVEKDIGFGTRTSWRSHFPDGGTARFSGKHFKDQTINEMKPKAQKIYAEAVKRGLGL
ncbi:hypothetical protein BMT55_16140 [Listeria newyorkensis]|uniref:Phage protein, HK97 gp10 family n=1 Tax=Listeria newyorkensis TaxID=1497681 RepID=A0ABX4XIV2_9LIST|nr:HK97-gp10 family putative phage morphogenesis protein [Listeria newyorkensis]PNP87453.1 hypothetical protein BMT55_16140 [Listeria newyorkensis]